MGAVNGTGMRNAKRGKLLLALLVVLSLVLAVWSNLWKEDLRIAHVDVEGNAIVGAEDIRSLAKIEAGTRLFDLDLFAVRERVETNHFVKSASVNRQLPNRVSISVVERVPIAAVITEKILYLDDEGVVLPSVRSESIYDIPVLTGTLPKAEIVPGKTITSAGIVEALNILAIAQQVDGDLYRRISEVHVVEGRDIVLYTAEFGVPVIFGHDNAAAKMVMLDGFWRQFVTRFGAQELQYIDLRFEDQVVVRWNHEKSKQVKTSDRFNILTKEYQWTTSL